MAKRGPKPKPAAARLLAGNPGKRKIRPDLPAPAGAPPMPKRLLLEPSAVEKWTELVPILLGLGTLTTADGEALATLCEVYAATQACLLELRASGPVMRTDLGGVKPNPAGPLYRSLVALQASLMGEFGLTPSSRVRLGGKEEKPSDEVEDFFKLHGA
jgi:P27 family predicted phage terminase small subunit